MLAACAAALAGCGERAPAKLEYPRANIVVISIDTAALAARQRRRPLARCLDELLSHGVLHLLGYDPEISVAEERRMARKALTRRPGRPP